LTRAHDPSYDLAQRMLAKGALICFRLKIKQKICHVDFFLKKKPSHFSLVILVAFD
jgi:hypothetical protein